jgi:hypothetical protein
MSCLLSDVVNVVVSPAVSDALCALAEYGDSLCGLEKQAFEEVFLELVSLLTASSG